MLERHVAASTLLAFAMAAAAFCADAPSDLRAVVEESRRAMGTENLKTIVISGEGFDSCVGQTYNPNSSWWRKYYNKSYVRSIDFDARGWRLQRVRGDGEVPPRGGCNPGPIPEVTQNLVVMAASGNLNAQVEFVLLPEGFLRVALERNATIKSATIRGRKYTVLSFLGDNKAAVNGYINTVGYVERVETTIANNVLGDIVWDATYTDWKDFNGVKFPTHILQHQGEPKYFELTVTDVKPNAPVNLTTATAGRGGGGRGGTPPADSEDLGGGFWLITGGYGAIVANFKDYVVVVEGPQNDARAEQIITEAKKLAPNKPIKFVVNTHSHFDHVGGLREFVAEGSTIVTSQVNKGYYERIFKYPRTLAPDKLSQMKPAPKTRVEYVAEKRVLTDGEHTIELHHIQNSTHNEGMLIAYLPKQKVLFEADEFNLDGINTAVPTDINPYHTNLLANIERLRLDVERLIPIHLPADGRKLTMAELYKAAGKKN